MPALPLAKPDAIGLDPSRLQRAYDCLKDSTTRYKAPAAALCGGRKGRIVEPTFFGRRRPEPDAPALKPDALFLVASITKPVTVAAVMILVERGELSLDDKVVTFVPRFGE